MKKILIVDDSSFTRSKLNRSLTRAGYTVIEAENGYAAIDQAAVEKPDIITLDLLMPEMPGFEALKKLQSINSPAKIIIVTADIQDQTRRELLDAGAHAFINKPVIDSELIDKIELLLNSG